MSNRARRRFLWYAQLDAAVSAGTLYIPDGNEAFQKEYKDIGTFNRSLRWAFRYLERKPLTFRDVSRYDPGLDRIRHRNIPDDFNLLRDSLYDLGASIEYKAPWEIIRLDFKGAEKTFNSARSLLEPWRRFNRVRFDWDSWARYQEEKDNPIKHSPWLEYLKSFEQKDLARYFLREEDEKEYPAYLYQAACRLVRGFHVVLDNSHDSYATRIGIVAQVPGSIFLQESFYWPWVQWHFHIRRRRGCEDLLRLSKRNRMEASIPIGYRMRGN
jgi:hypothetical protein